MTTRAQYRTNLINKFEALEDSGYGDFDFSDGEYNFYLSMGLAQLYPAIYQRLVIKNVPLVAYGTADLMYLPSPVPDVTTIFLIEDTTERQDVLGWRSSGNDVVNIDPWQSGGSGAQTVTNCDIHYHAPWFLDWTLDSNVDNIDIGVPFQFDPMIYLSATLEALESRQDTGIRGDPAPVGQFQDVSLIDRIQARLLKLKVEMAMSMPAIRM